jgi:lipoteichoic acid synthase
MDIDRTPMIIYNSEMEPLVVEDYTTIIDLLPTLLNMFNIDYDPRLYLGTDIFSSSHVSRAVFSDGSWQDANAYYYAPSSKITYYTSDFEYTVDELKKINKEITTRQKMSSLAITSNYFKYLGDGLEQYATTSSKESSKDED